METEENGVISDPMEEVRKLQSLVKHLELQNQQLRKKQIVGDNENFNGTTENGPNRPKQRTNGRTEGENGRVSEEKVIDKREKRLSASLDDVGLINIEDLELDDEASWLYMSPKKSPSEDPAITKWLRKDLEDPRNKELQLARRALAYKLDELAILNPGHDSFSSPDFSNPPLSKNIFGRIIDSRTFTRGKKKMTTFSDADSMPVIESGEYEDEPPPSKPATQSRVHAAPPRVPPMTDIIDVQEMARMQEESLRQSSPCSTPRRFTTGRKWSSSSRNSSTSEVEGLDGLQPLTKENLTSERRISSNVENSRVYRESCSDSTHSSPPESLRGSNNSLDKPNDSFHQSLPNLAKGYNGAVGHDSRTRPLNRVAAMNGTHHPLPPRSLALPSCLSSRSPVRISPGRSMGLPSRSVGNLQQQQQQQQQRQLNQSLPPRRLPAKSGSPLANGPPQALVVPAVAPTGVRSPSRRMGSPPRSRVLSPPSKSRLQAPSGSQRMPGSLLPAPRYGKIPSPKPRSGIPVPSSRQQYNSNPGSDSELWSDGCY